MAIRKQDWLFVGLAVVVVGTFYTLSGDVKTKKVPYDDKHKQFYELVKQKGKAGKKEGDIFCPQCHNLTGGIPFPPEHPVKPKDGPMGCHLCHKFQNIK